MTYNHAFKLGDVVYCREGETGDAAPLKGNLYEVVGFNGHDDVRLKGLSLSWRASRFRLAGVGEIAIYNACKNDDPKRGSRAQPRPAEASPLTSQVGGGHYKDCAIQPVEFVHANGLPFIEGSVVKYVSRWRKKGGIQDLKKAKHFLEMLIELEEKAAA